MALLPKDITVTIKGEVSMPVMKDHNHHESEICTASCPMWQDSKPPTFLEGVELTRITAEQQRKLDQSKIESIRGEYSNAIDVANTIRVELTLRTGAKAIDLITELLKIGDDARLTRFNVHQGDARDPSDLMLRFDLDDKDAF